MSNPEDLRLALTRLRRFLRARWEDKDERLFVTSSPRRPIAPPSTPRGLVPRPRTMGAPNMPAKPSPDPHQAPNRDEVSGSGQASRQGNTQPKPADRHPSGILHPQASDQGRALLAFYEQIKDCTKCPLGAGRINFVFGTGNPQAEVVFVGEGPGEQEDKQGLPFVGPAGHLLNRLLEAIGLPRDKVFIANVVKCRPPRNRPPQPEEIEECEPYLFEQIKMIGPKVIVALGTYAAQTLLKTTNPIGKLRGRWYKIREIDFLATYHPAAALRAGEYKKVIERDLDLVKQHLAKFQGSPAS